MSLASELEEDFYRLSNCRNAQIGYLRYGHRHLHCLDSDMADDNDWLLLHFSKVYPLHVAAFARLMIALRQDFDGDLDLMLVLTVIGDRWHHRLLSPWDPRQERPGAPPIRDAERAAININSIAAYTGIPRETVRRKVARLVARGWVAPGPLGDLRPTDQCVRDLQPATTAAMTYIRAVVAACDAARGSDG
jgi:hypothetical protein